MDFFIHHVYFPALFVGGFTLNYLLGKPWSCRCSFDVTNSRSRAFRLSLCFMEERAPTSMHSVWLKPTKCILTETRTTYQATEDVNEKRIQREKKPCVLSKVIVLSYRHFSPKKDIYPARQSGSVGHARCHTRRQYSKTGESMDLALRLLPVAIICCWERMTGQLATKDTNQYLLCYQKFSLVDGPLRLGTNVLGVRCTSSVKGNTHDSRQMCTAAAAAAAVSLPLLLRMRLKAYAQQQKREWSRGAGYSLSFCRSFTNKHTYVHKYVSSGGSL